MTDVPANKKTKATLEGDASTGSYSGVFEKAGDTDWVKLNLVGGVSYQFYLQVLDKNSQTNGDAFMVLYDANKNEQANNDNIAGFNNNAYIPFTPSATGTYFMQIGQLGFTNKGAYTLVAAEPFGATLKVLDDDDANYTAADEERVLAGKGADTINLGATGFDAFGEQGNDILIGNNNVNILSGGLGNDNLSGAGGSDTLLGDAGDDILNGGDLLDLLRGGPGKDSLDGGNHPDKLYGGAGKDTLTGGGTGPTAGTDVFFFTKLSDSKPGGANRDVITDFVTTDHIDLSAIDAKTGSGNQKFHFINAQPFHHKKGELHIVFKNGNTIVQGDVNGDGKADIEIALTGHHVLHATDFNL